MKWRPEILVSCEGHHAFAQFFFCHLDLWIISIYLFSNSVQYILHNHFGIFLQHVPDNTKN